MADKALLVLEDGSSFEGEAFGAAVESYGEVVFNTGMTGYQEVLTDPSYAGQIVMPTYPMVGNYGINPEDFESEKVQVRGFVVRQHSTTPSHWQAGQTLHEFLEAQRIPGISEVDTRAITRKLRSQGTMMGILTREGSPEEALERLKGLPRYGEVDLVKQVSTERAYEWTEEEPGLKTGPPYRITVLDLGLKRNILRILAGKGCRVLVVPAWVSAEAVMAAEPDGVLLSPGPGDPATLEYVIRTARGLLGRVPIMGICMGHQILAHALGGSTYKLKFGHRGGNHPVRDVETDRVHITAQNHGYAVDPDSLPSDASVSHVSLNDGAVEGMRHAGLPIVSIQYHSEAAPGPRDNGYMFDRFLEMVSDMHGA